MRVMPENNLAQSRAGRRQPHRSKLLAALLASVLGVFGAHWWYLGRRHAWLPALFSICMLAWAQAFDSWWDNPAFLALIIPILDGFIEALVFALKPDEWFDGRYNPGSGRKNETGWGPVLVAILTTFLGGTVFVFWIAMIVVHVYTAMGWLDGLAI